MSVFEVQRGAFGVSAAARAAARAYALAPDDATGVVRAREAARVALDDQGVHGVTPDVRVSCTPYPGDCHQGTSVITVSVHSRVVLPLMPSALGGNRPSFAPRRDADRADRAVPGGRRCGMSAAPAR